MSAPTTAKTKQGKPKRKPRNANRKLLKKVRGKAELAALAATPTPTHPTDAIQLVLDRAVFMLHFAGSKVETLTEDEMWRDTMVGRIPNEWVRLEAELRKEVGGLAARMLQLDIEGRKADANRALAELIAGVVRGAAEKAGIAMTPEFKGALRGELEALNGSGKEKEKRQ